MNVKQVMSHGFSLNNPELGYPFGLPLQDFPFTDFSYLVIIKVLSAFSTNPFVVTNLFFLLSFVLCSVSAFLSLRLLKIPPSLAMLGGLLFSFLPYHLIRGPYHLFLSGYWVAPLVCCASLWLLNQRHPLFLSYKWSYKTRAFLSAALVILVATSGLYYALFSLFLLSVSGFIAGFKYRSKTSVLWTLGFVILTVVILALQSWPSIRYIKTEGKNQEIGVRQAYEIDNNSLSLVRLAFPLQSFGLPALEKYAFQADQPVLRMEERQFIGLAGLLGLAAITMRVLFCSHRDRHRQSLWWSIFILVFAIYILAMPGGVSSIIAYTISPQVRAYGRILPFLAFFAILGCVLLFEELATKPHRQLKRTAATTFLLVSLFLQVSWYQPPASVIQTAFASDTAFFGQIDALRPNAVYQLPFKAFPETPPVHKLGDYDLLKGYLHSRQPTAWSYATMKGRDGSQWFATLAQFPINVQVQTARELGFEGAYLDRFGYPDNGHAIEASLSALLSQPPIVSQDGRLVYYQL